jgi:hypothetical protein
MAGDARDATADQGSPWAGPFDPAANVRALGDIQRRGLRAAADVVERLVTAVDGADGHEPTAGGAATAGPGASAADLQAAVELWAELARRSLQALAGLVPAAGPVPAGTGSPVPAGATLVDVGAKSPAAGLRLSPGGDSVEVWLHNGTHDERRDLRFHCGELRSHDGSSLGVAVTFAPAVVDRLPGRSSRGVAVAVGPRGNGSAAAPGTYRGLVLVTGLPDAWLPIEVTVGP